MRVPVLAIVVCLTPALASPQSLGDVARHEARKRTTEVPLAAAPRSYTDDDLRPEKDGAAGGPAGTAASEAVALPPALATDDDVRARLDREAAERKERELYWRQLCGTVRAHLASAEREHDTVCGPGVLVLTGG